MPLYLVQHGHALTRQEDPARPLSPAGAADVRRIGEVAAGYGVRVGRIWHSGKARAAGTAAILDELLQPAGGIEAVAGIGPNDDVAAFAERIAGVGDLMVVGHLPFLSRLTSHLITGAAERPVFVFQNGGIVCLGRLPHSGGWAIRWALQPEVG